LIVGNGASIPLPGVLPIAREERTLPSAEDILRRNIEEVPRIA
jgi:hypothetical protein